MNKRNLASFLLLVWLSIAGLTGCWGAKEPDHMAYVLSIGIDKGKENIVNVTFQIAVPRGLEGGGEGEPSDIISLEAASLFGALQLANAFTSRETTFLHNRVVVVSEEIAREGVDKYINPLLRSRQLARNTFIFITQGSAREFIVKNKPKLETYPSRQYDLLLDLVEFAAFTTKSTLTEFNERMKSPGRDAVATLVSVNEGRKGMPTARTEEEKALYEVAYLAGHIAREGGNVIEAIGLAAFHGEKLVGYLNGAETRYYLMASGEYNRAVFTFPDPKKPKEYIIVVEIAKGRAPDIQVQLSEEKVRIKVGIVLEGELYSIQSGINYESGENAELLRRYLEEYITREVKKVIQKTQEEFKSDIFGFGEYAKKYFWTWQDWVNYNWASRYPEAEVEVETELLIRRPGLMAKTVPIIKSDEVSNYE